MWLVSLTILYLVGIWSLQYGEAFKQKWSDLAVTYWKKLQIAQNNIEKLAHEMALQLSKERINEADQRLAFAQASLSKIIHKNGDNIKYSLEKVLRRSIVQDEMWMVFHTKPMFHIGEDRMERSRLVSFSFSLSLSKQVPPEFVVEQLLEEMRIAILRQWQHQSLLLTGKLQGDNL